MVDLVSKARRGSTLATTPQREEKTHLLYGVPDHVARDVHFALLPQPDGACDGLALDAGVPLQLDDEDAVGAGEVEPESFSSVPRICTRGRNLWQTARGRSNVPEPAGTRRHDQHRHLVVLCKPVELGLALRERTGAVDADIRNLGVL